MNTAPTQPLMHIKLRALSRTFGQVRALSNVNGELNARDVVAVMGGNGAGKSTLLSLISTTMRPTTGQILFDGNDAIHHGDELRARIGYLSHKSLVYSDLTAEENLKLYAALYGLTNPARIDAVRQQMSLEEFFSDRPARVLSRGQLQRLALARAFLHQPALLLLDEPAAGLDAPAIDRIASSVEGHRDAGGISVVVTHEPALAARIATRLWLIHQGKLVYDGSCPDSDAEVAALFQRHSLAGAR